MATMNLLVFLGSTREGRMGERVGKYVKRKLEERGHHVTILDPLELNLAVVHQPLHFYRNPADAPQQLRTINKQIQEADGFVVVAGEYNSAISPALCAMMDNFPPTSYSYRPSAIVTYSMGSYGGFRSAMQLRDFLGDLLTVVCPNITMVSKVHERVSEDGTLNHSLLSDQASTIDKYMDNTIEQLEFYCRAIKNERKHGVPKPVPLG